MNKNLIAGLVASFIAIIHPLTLRAQDSMSGLMRSAIECYDNGDRQKAYYFLEKELRNNPTNGLAYLYKAKVYSSYSLEFAFRNLAEAMTYIPESDEKNYVDAVILMATCLNDAGETDMAVEELDNLLARHSSFEALRLRTLIASDDDSAIADAYKVIGATHDDDVKSSAYEHIALRLMSKGQLTEASAAVSEALRLVPYGETALDVVTLINIQQNRYKDAMRWACTNYLRNKGKYAMTIVECIATLHPDSCFDVLREFKGNRTFSAYGVADLEARADLAAHRYAQAYKVGRQFCCFTHRGMAKVAQNVGLFGEADSILTVCVAEGEDFALAARARNRMYMGDFDSARRLWGEAIDAHPTDPVAYDGMANLCLLDRKYSDAYAYADTALQLGYKPAWLTMLRYKNMVYVTAEGHARYALSELSTPKREEGMSAMLPPSPEPGYKLVLSAMANDTTLFEEVLAKTAGFEDDWFFASMAYAILGEDDKALDALETAFDKGFCFFIEVVKAPEFAKLRNTERFASIMRKAQEKYMSTINELCRN